jgi:D-arabinose 1-dehydrogenase-like Zn-dependent alcohol dehydrogenase
MKKFVLLTIGFIPPTPEIMKSWMRWIQSIDEHIIVQMGLRNGKEVTKYDVTDLAMDHDTITGIVVINANDIDEALTIAKSSPMITSTKVYEVMTHEST